MPEQAPSRIRIRALREYEALSGTISDLEAATQDLKEQGEPALDAALVCATKLLEELSAYVDLEQLVVLPAVRAADIWGDLRAAALERRHAARKDELRTLRRDLPHTVEPQVLVEDLTNFTQRLRESLEHEKHEILNSDVLRDDVVETEPD